MLRKLFEAMETLMLCPLCSQGELEKVEPAHFVRGWSIVRCPCCRVGLTNPRPDPQEIGAYYIAGFFSSRPDDTWGNIVKEVLQGKVGLRSFRRRGFAVTRDALKLAYERCLRGSKLRRTALLPVRWALALMFEPVLVLPAKPGKVLDIGFGRGEFLLRAKRLGWEAHGVEVSDTSVEWGRSLGVEVRKFDGSFREPLDYPDGFFDFVLMNNVLEHVHNPPAALRECARCLKPGGTVAVLVPNFSAHDIRFCGDAWQGWNVPQHLTHFEDYHVEAAMKEAGLQPVSVRHKIWYNILTDLQSLKRMRKRAADSGRSLSLQERVANAWTVGFGKRLRYLTGRLPKREVGAGFCVYGKKPED